MSRIGKKPVEIPAGVEVKVDGNKVIVKGAKGTLEQDFVSPIAVVVEGNQVLVSRPNDEKENRSLQCRERHSLHNELIDSEYGIDAQEQDAAAGDAEAQPQGNGAAPACGFGKGREAVGGKGAADIGAGIEHARCGGYDAVFGEEGGEHADQD